MTLYDMLLGVPGLQINSRLPSRGSERAKESS
jgi:hypothetical protein